MNREFLLQLQASLPQGTRLVAVSKFHPAADVLEAYHCGQRIFGENHVQEIVAKHEQLPDDIEWHFIGHLQTNKVARIVPFVKMIHSVDSLRLLREINKHAARIGRTIPCLLELHVAHEVTKYGLSIDDCRQLLDDGEWRALKNVKICGLMCMATQTDDKEEIHKEFRLAHNAFNEFKERFFRDDDAFCERSWGMSNDYPIALEESSTLIRVGTKIFGPRM